MSLALTKTRAKVGIHAPYVHVEVHLSAGLPKFSIVGLPETGVKESKERVRSALINSGYKFPNQRITVNLAPANLPKEGGRYDLPIAIGILIASGQLDSEHAQNKIFLGELSLSGDLRATDGLLPVAIESSKQNEILVIPEENLQEIQLIDGLKVIANSSLNAIIEAFHQAESYCVIQPQAPMEHTTHAFDFSDIKGQAQAKRSLEIAAAGRHHLLMIGPPGTGKTMLASRLSSILPLLSKEEAIEVAALYSISDAPYDYKSWHIPPFRAPHHNISSAALIGGGSIPKPGEISLAHQGVLFLDELGEFSTKILDHMRQPLESGYINIARAAQKVMYPAHFQLITAMNPIEKNKNPNVTDEAIKRYANKVSSPLIDRIDIHIEVPRINYQTMINTDSNAESSQVIRERVLQARLRQINRGYLNADIPARQIDSICQMKTEAKETLKRALEKLNLSSRAYHRILKVAKTIADLEALDLLEKHHIAEALHYRLLDRINI